MHEVLINRLGGLSLPRKSVVRLTDGPDMALVVYRGRKTTQQNLEGQILSFNSLPPLRIPIAQGVKCWPAYQAVLGLIPAEA